MEIDWDAVKQDEQFKEIVKSSAEEMAKSLVTTKVEEAISDLKSKNSELIGEKRKLAEKLEAIKDFDFEKAKKAMDFVDKDETAKLLAEGKFDEVIEARTAKVKDEYDSKIQEILEAKAAAESEVSVLRKNIDSITIETHLRKIASKAGILPDAMDDVLLRGQMVFSVGEDGNLEARDKNGDFIKVDGKILTPGSWISSLPQHYWPSSDGVGGTGGTGGDVDEKLAAAAKSGNISAYRKLRAKNKKK